MSDELKVAGALAYAGLAVAALLVPDKWLKPWVRWLEFVIVLALGGLALSWGFGYW